MTSNAKIRPQEIEEIFNISTYESDDQSFNQSCSLKLKTESNPMAIPVASLRPAAPIGVSLGPNPEEEVTYDLLSTPTVDLKESPLFDNAMASIWATENTEAAAEVAPEQPQPQPHQDQQEHGTTEGEKESFTTSEVVFEVDLPVIGDINADFNSQWANQVQNNVDQLHCVNPFDVEGKKPIKKNLPKITMPTSNKAEPALDTPTVEETLKDVQGFDLLEYVTNTELPVEDPEFLALIASETPTTSSDLNTIDVAAIKSEPEVEDDSDDEDYLPVASTSKASVAKTTRCVSKQSNIDDVYSLKNSLLNRKRGRGRPPAASKAKVAKVAEDANEDCVKEQKYRRMRDLNNLASKRCRQNRKRKLEAVEEEEHRLKIRNGELKMRCRHLEDLVGKMKRQFIAKVTNPSKNTFNLDDLIDSRLGEM